MTSLAQLSDPELLDAWRDLEARRRRIDAEEISVLAEVRSRGLARAQGCKNDVDLARFLLRIPAAEAKARVEAAVSFGPRASVTGEPLGPLYPVCADAIGDGSITVRAGLAIVEAVEKLPVDQLEPGAQDQVEAQLVVFARQHDSAQTARFAHHLVSLLDQDGALACDAEQQRRREVILIRRPDGAGKLSGELTVELAEALHTALDTYAAPRPAADGTPDPRSAGQRRHDGLLDLVRAGIRAGITSAPESAGCRTTVILTIDADDFATGHGVAITGHGYAIPVQLAMRWLEPRRPRLATRRRQASTRTGGRPTRRRADGRPRERGWAWPSRAQRGTGCERGRPADRSRTRPAAPRRTHQRRQRPPRSAAPTTAPSPRWASPPS